MPTSHPQTKRDRRQAARTSLALPPAAAPHRASSARHAPLATALLDSELGWIAFATHRDAVVRLTFGHDTPADAIGSLGRSMPAGVFDEALDLADNAGDMVYFDPEDMSGSKRSHDDRFVARVARRLARYAAAGDDPLLDIPIQQHGMTPFQAAVVERCRRIPPSETLSYQELAAAVGRPRAARAVGNVMRTNRVPLIVPCHRVIGAGGSLGGYSAPQGLAMKRRLLDLERRPSAVRHRAGAKRPSARSSDG